MCVAVIAWHIAPQHPWVIALNRDEVHSRPSLPAHWWPDRPGIYAGRDAVHGDTWCGVSRSGRFPVVLSRTSGPLAVAAHRSRGNLVAAWLAESFGRERFATVTMRDLRHYRGFVLVIGDGTGVSWISGPEGQCHSLNGRDSAILGFSNSSQDSGWPKVKYLRERLKDAVTGEQFDTESILGTLHARQVPNRLQPPADAVWPKTASRPFVLGTKYGTRASMVLRRTGADIIVVREQTFSSDGLIVTDTEMEFEVRPPPAPVSP